MKTKRSIRFLFSLLLFGAASFSPPLFAQGTAFTYQGRLTANGQSTTGLYDFNFQVFDAANAGNSIGGTVNTNGVPITNGLFTVTLDFGTAVFTGPSRWLQISVSTNNANNYFTLAPRQKLTPTPYAVYGETAGLANTVANGTVSSAQLNTLASPTSGQVLEYNGTSLAWTTPATGTSAWGLAGNAGTTAGVNFLGTTDNQPLELHVNGLRGLRLEPTANTGFANNAINVIAGSPANFAAGGVLGVTIAGGGAPYYFGSGTANRAFDNFTTIGGGVNNDIETNSWESTIAGGNANSIRSGAYRSVIAGGWANSIGTNSYHSVIGGGVNNTIKTNAVGSTIGGGYGNSVPTNAQYATISGGYGNNAGGTFSSSSSYGYTTIGGGYGNTAGGTFGYSTVGGGYNNTAGANYSIVGGGSGNSANGAEATVSGGLLNSASGTGASVAGGVGNTANGQQSFAAGASAHANNNNSFVWSDGSAAYYDSGANTFNVLATGGYYMQGIYGKSVSGTPAAVYVNSSGQLGTGVPNSFIQTATSNNTQNYVDGSGGFTVIDSPLCNGNPNAILLVTPNNVSYQNYRDFDHPICVDYNGYAFPSKWAITILGGNMNTGMQFNVLVANP